jgi:hypothetical protein
MDEGSAQDGRQSFRLNIKGAFTFFALWSSGCRREYRSPAPVGKHGLKASQSGTGSGALAHGLF